MLQSRPLFGSHSDTSAINLKYLVTDLFSQMREPSPAGNSPKGSTSSLNVTRNIGFQQQNGSEPLPWSNPTISLPGNCNSNLTNDSSVMLRSVSNASALTSLCPDLSLSDSHFFEVLYIGKVRISQRKVPETLIDDALNKFSHHEAEKRLHHRRHSLLSSTGTSLDSTEGLEENPTEKFIRNSSLMPSTTPLEPDKISVWKSAENLQKPEKNEVDKEFDIFSKERLDKNNKIPVPLEPSVVILNVPKQNLGTVDEGEEKHDDIPSFKTNLPRSEPKDIPKLDEMKTNNPFKVNLFISESPETKDNKVIDPLLNIPIKVDDLINTKDKVDDLPNEKEIVENKNINKIEFEDFSRKVDIGKDVRRQMTPDNKPFLRDRSASIGTLNLKTPLAQLIGEQNRTMLFQVGRSELRLISPDRKQILLHRAFKDVASCVLGRSNKEHFGFVCRETNDTYACYVFKCESDSVATEVVSAIKQAFIAHADFLKKSREKSPGMTCEHCPMLWYHRLCHDIEGMNEKKVHAFILRRIEQLPDDEQETIITKYQGGTNHMYEVCEHNAFLMMLLRAHCEAKQQRHVHDTAENRSEFLNQYLGGSTIFMKAKRHLSSGFDHLLKRRQSKDDITPPAIIKKEASPVPTISAVETSSEPTKIDQLNPESPRCKSISPADITNDQPATRPPAQTPPRPSDIGPTDQTEQTSAKDEPSPVTSPIMDIFLKVSDSRPLASDIGTDSDATWRQAIYEKVVQTPNKTENQNENDQTLTQSDLLGHNTPRQGKRSREELRQLWKMAIDQTILLVRMENENAKLREREESSAVRRIKLEYTELGVCDAGVSLMWDNLLSRDKSQPVAKVDRHMLKQAVWQGVPRMSRGGVWFFLAEQTCIRLPPPDTKQFPHYNTPYRTLLSGLTKHQHAILIDLGRTFPKHSYFASALGPGQLALYNLLKAYSLLDPDVGYCQGLSFVAGVLLLHMEEAEAFILLRHLMLRRGLRRQYLPDMSALQVQLYQHSRLLRDHEPELHAKLEALDISPALYAAPWMLTLFTSQFPLGFVVRVFDLIFLNSLDVVFAISLALLSAHKDGLMMCESCEEAAEYLKHKLPDMDKGIYDKVMKTVHKLDISQQLTEYSVEYSVLREEMPRLASLHDINRELQDDNARMTAELDSAMEAITSYQKTQTKLETQNKILEHHVTLLSRYILANHRQEIQPEIKKIVQNYGKKLTFSSKITSFTKFSSNEDEEDKKIYKTGVSAPNLFSKTTREEVLNAANRIEDRKHFMMKKSQSIHSGLIASKQLPLKALQDEIKASPRKHSLRIEDLANDNPNLKNKSSSTQTQEQIRQARLFEQQLKHDFDENLKKLDEKISNKSYLDDLSIFQSKKSLSLNLNPEKESTKLVDSGFVTPMSPKEDKKDDGSVISHPLSDCDVDIKFDGQLTKLKQIRPLKISNRDS